jgi:hypothetical protein
MSSESRTFDGKKQTYVHVIEALVDSAQIPGVSDEFIYPECSVHVV